MKFDYPLPETVECPYPLLAQARRECPVARAPIPEEAHYISRYDDVLEVLRNPELFANHARAIGTAPVDRGRTPGGLGIHAMLDSDPPDHFHHRKIATRRLNPRAFAEAAPMVRRHVDALIDSFIDRGECEFISEFAERLPERVITEMMGYPKDFADRLRKWGQIEFQGIPFYPEARKQHQLGVLQDYFATVTEEVRKRAEAPTDDVLGQMIRDQIARDGSFNLEYVALQIGILTAGGLITTGHMMGHALHFLLTHPDQLAQVLAEPELMNKAINETVRLETPIQWVPRRVTRDTELRGVKLRAGSHVMVGLASANRDPEKFADPDRFDMHREGLNQHVAFGHGTHFCLGVALARVETMIAFERLFARLRNIRLSDHNDYRHIDSTSFRGFKAIHLEFERA